MKTCSGCKQAKSFDQYYKHHTNKDGYSGKCKTCRKLEVRNNKLQVNYGITSNDYQNLLILQDSRCGICNDYETIGRTFAVDHCHKTGSVRGLLCFNCNTALGKFKDSPALLLRIADYLSKKPYKEIS